MKFVGITRFDVRLERHHPSRPPPEWYTSRLALFHEVFAPSIRAQTRTPDDWLIFTREDTPAWAEGAVTRAAATMNARVIRTAAIFGPEVVRAALPMHRWSTERLVTFRCDNDDGLDQYVIETIAEEAQRGRDTPFVVNVLNGVQYRKGYLYRRLDPSSPFVALVEGPLGTSKPATVFTIEHDLLVRTYPIVHIRTAMWWQSLHDDNLGNQSYGIAIRNSVPDGFAHLASVRLKSETSAHLAVRRVASFVRLAARIMLSRARRRWLLAVLRGQLFPNRP